VPPAPSPARIAQFGRSLAGDVSRRMFAQFAEAVAEDRDLVAQRQDLDVLVPAACRQQPQ
jgi:hypothetical protein